MVFRNNGSMQFLYLIYIFLWTFGKRSRIISISKSSEAYSLYAVELKCLNYTK